MHKKPTMPPAGEAILAGDIETMRRLIEDGSLLYRKGKIVRLREDIPIDEETDMSLSEIIEENCSTDVEWWEKFTKYYDGVLDETDGYVDDPEVVVCHLTATQTLKIEFHPGDTVYYVNDKQIASTGGHYSIQIFPFTDLLKYAEIINDNRIFFLLLPLTIIKKQDVDKATQIISNYLKDIFDVHLCNLFANSIVYGLTEE